MDPGTRTRFVEMPDGSMSYEPYGPMTPARLRVLKRQLAEMEGRMKYRHRPIEVDAMRYRGEINGPQVAAWCGGTFVKGFQGDDQWWPARLTIDALVVASGDWVVRDAAGEYHAYKPDVFAAAYEPVDG